MTAENPGAGTEKGEVAIKAVISSDGMEVKDGETFVGLHFMISDTGIGVSDIDKEKIFLDFTQADSSSTRSYGGTGLGLSISMSLVKLMGGNIWLESEPGKGSVFHFTIKSKFQNGARLEKSKHAYADFSKASVLVVDDSATNRFILLKTLSAWGMNVSEAASGEDALSRLEGEGKIVANPPANKRRKRGGKVTFADNVRVTFPPVKD